MPSPTARRLAVLIAAIVAVVVTYGQLWLQIGQSQSDLAADGNSTLAVAGYAFSIWGLIYLGLLIYAVRQALPGTPESAVLSRLGWPSAAAFVGLALWTIASAADWKWTTVALIFAQWLILLFAMLAARDQIRALGARAPDRIMAVWPLAALIGWLSAAAPLNLVTVLTATDNLPAALSQHAWAILFIALIAAIALFVTARLKTIAYPLPIVWALVGAYVAEREGSPLVAGAALAAAAALLIFALYVLWRQSRSASTSTAS